jgi:dimethylhistidine N-methyltransferase
MLPSSPLTARHVSKQTNPKSGLTDTFGDRLQLDYLMNPDLLLDETEEGLDVVIGLSRMPKQLPPKYFYDDRGSELFDQICELPEYYLTRTEASILQACAPEVAQITGACELVELGSGSSTKTRILLDAYQQQGYDLRYLPIDISSGALEVSACRLLLDYPALRIHGLVGTYDIALANLPPSPLPTRLVFFLGSTLGNLNPYEYEIFIEQVRDALQPGEYFLLGIDLQKPQALLEAAYNDSQGVTAAFNRNMLNHLNWRFQGNFQSDRFQHEATYNQTLHQIEIYLRSTQAQTVQLCDLNLTIEFTDGEAIHTEISRKFNLATVQQDLHDRNLVPVRSWTDANQWFGLILCRYDLPLPPSS